MTNAGVVGFPSASAAPAPALPVPASGQYFFTASDAGTGQSAVLVNGTLRLVPWVVTKAVTINQLGGEVTSGGDSGCKLRLGIYSDNGNAYPGQLVLDAGTIAGDSIAVATVTFNNLTLPPGLYWVGGAVQLVTTTQPTVRTIGGWVPPVRMPLASAPSAGLAVWGFNQTSVTGALPAVFTTTVTAAALAPRLFAKVA